MNTFLEKREDGKYKLIENILIPASDIKPLPLTEESREIVRNGKKYKCIAAYTFPISRPDNENLNGRIYSSALWENVINKKMGNGNFGLCDHPEGDGSVKDAFTVWHNIRFSESRQLIVADAYLFGEWGRHCKEAIDAGGKIGLSSVGYFPAATCNTFIRYLSQQSAIKKRTLNKHQISRSLWYKCRIY